MSQVTTTITIQFGDNANSQGFLAAEIDSRPDGLNAGRSQFMPEEVVWFLIYAGSNVSYNPPVLSDGQLLRGADVLVAQEEILTFANSRESRLAKPAEGGLVISWFGTALGGTKLGSDQMTVLADKAGVAVAQVRYKARAQAWGIKAPKTSGGQSNYSIAVVIVGNTKEK
jgi:hypothetical protein